MIRGQRKQYKQHFKYFEGRQGGYLGARKGNLCVLHDQPVYQIEQISCYRTVVRTVIRVPSFHSTLKMPVNCSL